VGYVSAIAAPRPANPRPPVSYLNSWWAVTQTLLTGLIILALLGLVLVFVGYAAPLPLGVRGARGRRSGAPPTVPPGRSTRACWGSGSWTSSRSRRFSCGWGAGCSDRFLLLDVRLRLADTTLAMAGVVVMQGRKFTLASLPLRVRAYGRTQTDPVVLSQPVGTACPLPVRAPRARP
jgi:hypothetical protein